MANFLTDPRQMGLLMGGLQMMQAAGPSRVPVGVAQGLGQGGMAGLLGARQAQQDALQQGLLSMRIQQMQNEMKQADDWQKFMSGASAGNPAASGLPGGPGDINQQIPGTRLTVSQATQLMGHPYGPARAYGKAALENWRATLPYASVDANTAARLAAEFPERAANMPHEFLPGGTPPATPGAMPQQFPRETPAQNQQAGNAQLRVLEAEVAKLKQAGQLVPNELMSEIARAQGRSQGGYPTAQAPMVTAPTAPAPQDMPGRPRVNYGFNPGESINARAARIERQQKAQTDFDAKLEEERREAAKVYPKKVAEATAERRTKIIEEAKKIDEQKDLAADAIKSLQEYRSKTLAGTGPFATGFGLKRYTDEDLATMEAKFQKLSLESMVKMFEGMSRAIDSQADRAAFDRTQPNIKLDDKVNAQILVGSISMAMKGQAEAQAQAKWIDDKKTLEGYVSPVIGQTTVMFDPTGTPHLIYADRRQDAARAGMMTPDQYVELIHRGEGAPMGKPAQKAPEIKFRGFLNENR